MSAATKLDRDLFPLTAFLATAARGGLEEGIFSATFRLVDTISRLLKIFPELLEDQFFHDLAAFLNKNQNKAYLMSEAEYEKFLDDLLRRFAVEVCKRNGVEHQTS